MGKGCIFSIFIVIRSRVRLYPYPSSDELDTMANEGSRDEVLNTLRQVAETQSRLVAAVEALNDRVGLPSLSNGSSTSLRSASGNTEISNDAVAPMTSSEAVTRPSQNEDGSTTEASTAVSP